MPIEVALPDGRILSVPDTPQGWSLPANFGQEAPALASQFAKLAGDGIDRSRLSYDSFGRVILFTMTGSSGVMTPALRRHFQPGQPARQVLDRLIAEAQGPAPVADQVLAVWRFAEGFSVAAVVSADALAHDRDLQERITRLRATGSVVQSLLLTDPPTLSPMHEADPDGIAVVLRQSGALGGKLTAYGPFVSTDEAEHFIGAVRSQGPDDEWCSVERGDAPRAASRMR